MFLAEPQRTPYDLHFQFLGFDVRVSPFFWLAAALLGWQSTNGLASIYSNEGLSSFIQQLPEEARPAGVKEFLAHQSPVFQQRYASNPGQGMLLLIWISAVFVSILIHELGHALAFRRCGIGSYVVLYHFGGLAVPNSSSSFMGTSRRLEPRQQIFISAAGPGMQLVLAGVIILLVKASGYAVPTYVPYISDWLHFSEGEKIGSMPLYAVIDSLLWPSIFWALLNLLPIYPLDGGQISRELFTLYSGGEGVRNSLMLSIFAAGGVAVYGFANEQTFLGLMFGMLAFSSFQILQAFSGRGGYGPQ